MRVRSDLVKLLLALLIVFHDAPASARPAGKAHGSKTHNDGKQSEKESPVAKSREVKTTEAIDVVGSTKSIPFGGGMIQQEETPHSAQTVGKKYIDMKSPTSTPLDLVRTLPSVNVMPADTSGMQGGSIESRSLTDADMGLMLNGAPSTSAVYLNLDADSENISSITLTPGTSATELPTTSAAAGVMNVATRDPDQHYGGLVDFSYGTNNLSREFIRLDSGEIGNSGIKTYASFSNAHSRQWIGAGINNKKHVDFGLRKDFLNGSFERFFISWNGEDYTAYNYPNLDQWNIYKKTGTGYGSSAENTGSAAGFWGANINHYNQIFLSSTLHLVITDRLSYDLKPYFNFGQGWQSSNGGYSTAANKYYNSSGEAIAAGTQLTSFYQANNATQVGVVTALNYKIDRHNVLSLGYWYENNSSDAIIPLSTTLPGGWGGSPNDVNRQVFVTNGSGKLVRKGTGIIGGYELHSIFVKDQAKYLKDNLVISAGFKFVMSNFWDYLSINGSRISETGLNSTIPLPQLAVGYRIDDNNSVYFNVEGDFRQPAATSLTPDQNGKLQRNQYSIKEELGYRYNNKYFLLDLSLFNYNITNRLLSTYLGGGRTGTINAGNQTARGLDVMIAGRPFHNFSPYASVEYLHATIDNNIAYGTSYLPTKGNQAVMAPRVMANFGLTYNHKGLFGNFSLHYAGPQSVTLVGDERIPGYVSDTLSLGYRFKPILFAKSPEFKINFTNITGSVIRTGAKGIGTNIYPVSLVNGSQGPAAGSGAQFYVEPRFSMTGTVSTAF